MPAASFDRGYLLRNNPYDAQGGDGLFFVGPADSVLKTVRLWPDGAAAVSVFDTAAMPDGSLIVASQAVSTDEKRAFILYGVDSNGQVRFRVRTNPFAITHLVATDDSHIWALGSEPAAEQSGSKTGTAAAVSAVTPAATASEGSGSSSPARDELAVVASNGHAAKSSNGNGMGTVTLSLGATNVAFKIQEDAPSCAECGSIMVRNGSCYKCLNCGSTSGCS